MSRRPIALRSPRRVPSAAAVPWRWACAGALLGAFGMSVWAAPASWLATAVSRATSGRVELAEPDGTVWRGSARLVLSGGVDSRDAMALPSRVSWVLRPRWVGADAELASSCCTAPEQPLRLSLRQHFAGSQLQVRDARVQLPGTWLTGLGAPWNTIEPSGQLSLTTHGLAVQVAHQRADLRGEIRVLLKDAATRLTTIRPVGSYEVVVQGGEGAGGGVNLALSSLPGSQLLLSGSGQWVGGRLRFRGEASATPERAAVLGNLLNIIGKRNGTRSVISLG